MLSTSKTHTATFASTKTFLTAIILMALVNTASSFYFYPRARVFDPYAGILVPHHDEFRGLVPTRRSLASEMAALQDPIRTMTRDPFFSNMLKGFDELVHEFDVLNRAIADAQPKVPELTIERPEDSDTTRLTISGVSANQLEVTVDHALLTLAMTSADGRHRVSRTLQLPRNVADAEKLSAFVEGDTLVVDVPDAALEPEPKHVRTSIAVQRLDAKATASPADGATSDTDSVTKTASKPPAAEQGPEEEMTVHDVPDDL